MGKQTAENESKPAKKLGFLGILLRIFLFFVLLMALATPALYYYRRPVTAHALQFYGTRLAAFLTRADHCELPSDYELPSDHDPAKKSVARFLDDKRVEIDDSFQEMVAVYRKTGSQSDWYSSLRDLDRSVSEMFGDRKITFEELERFLAEVKSVSEKHSASAAAETPVQESAQD